MLGAVQLSIELSARLRSASIQVRSGGDCRGSHLAPRTGLRLAEPWAPRPKGVSLSITFDILTALAEHPGGEAPIATVKDRLVQVALSPVRLNGVVQDNRRDPKHPDLLYHHRPRDPDTLQNLFSSGLVERPRPGVWKLTDKGRTFLAGLGSGTARAG